MGLVLSCFPRTAAKIKRVRTRLAEEKHQIRMVALNKEIERCRRDVLHQQRLLTEIDSTIAFMYSTNVHAGIILEKKKERVCYVEALQHAGERCRRALKTTYNIDHAMKSKLQTDYLNELSHKAVVAADDAMDGNDSMRDLDFAVGELMSVENGSDDEASALLVKDSHRPSSGLTEKQLALLQSITPPKRAHARTKKVITSRTHRKEQVTVF